jgi:ferredoxin-NADP reductase
MLSRFTAAARQRWFLDRDLQFWLAELGSAWARSALRARVVEVLDETAEARTLVLAPNGNWPGHRAGQYVPVSVEIDGVRKRRCYSISSGASAAGPGARIAITVARVAGGAVSNHLHDRVRAGDLIDLGAPAGDFVVDDGEQPLLFVAGGSGVTPIAAILRDLEARGERRDIVVLHSARDDASAIFGGELAAMQHPALRVVAHCSGVHGRLDALRIRSFVPDLADRAIYACGPAGLVDAVTAAAGHDRVVIERFVAAPVAVPRPAASATVQLRDRRVALDGNGTLLEQLERAGERPAHGCRMGICNTCRCTKLRGTVVDLATGRSSDAVGEDIRLCVSIAQSDLELDL